MVDPRQLNAVYRVQQVEPPGLDELAERERAKYEKVWERSPIYARASPGQRHAPEVYGWYHANECKTFCDFGAGDGRTIDTLIELGVRPEDVCGVDLIASRHERVIGNWNLWADALPYPSDFGMCCDVLEHIPPKRVDDVLANLAASIRVAGWFQIAMFEDKAGADINETLHLTVEAFAWWHHKVGRHFRVVHSWDRHQRAVFYVIGSGWDRRGRLQ